MAEQFFSKQQIKQLVKTGKDLYPDRIPLVVAGDVELSKRKFMVQKTDPLSWIHSCIKSFIIEPVSPDEHIIFEPYDSPETTFETYAIKHAAETGMVCMYCRKIKLKLKRN